MNKTELISAIFVNFVISNHEITKCTHEIIKIRSL